MKPSSLARQTAEPEIPASSSRFRPPISVSIVAHPSRSAYVDNLIEALYVPPRICWDSGDGQWRTAANALAMYDPNATHHIVLEDDAIPCVDLVAGVGEVIRREPEAIISLYTGSVRPWPQLVRLRVEAAMEQGACLFDMQGPLWGVGLVFPTWMIDGLLAWSQGRKEPYDERIAKYAKGQGVRCVYTFPSLVDHRQGPSIYQGRPRRRSAIVDIPTHALDVDWQAPKVLAPECGYVKRPRGWACWWCAHVFMAEDRAKRHKCRHRV